MSEKGDHRTMSLSLLDTLCSLFHNGKNVGNSLYFLFYVMASALNPFTYHMPFTPLFCAKLKHDQSLFLNWNN